MDDSYEDDPHSIYGDIGEITDIADAGDADPEGPDDGSCTPFPPDLVGNEYTCQGIGNGWLVLTVHPVGGQPPECVNWGANGKPEEPTTADCIPMQFGAFPDAVPKPGACCAGAVTAHEIIEQCAADCGYAACKLAVAKLRNAALALPNKGAKGVVRADLFYLANLLESPVKLASCAEQVSAAAGESTAIPLGPGSSGAKKFGHVRAATLHLQCSLDAIEPFAASDKICEAPPNLPTPAKQLVLTTRSGSFRPD